jgi:hypothetical protein
LHANFCTPFSAAAAAAAAAATVPRIAGVGATPAATSWAPHDRPHQRRRRRRWRWRRRQFCIFILLDLTVNNVVELLFTLFGDLHKK